jgi:acyl-CoA thioester hydrolase
MMTTTADAPFLFRVCYSDTDAAGVVYHARYLEMFERSRADWLYRRNLSPSLLVKDCNLLLPVRELTMNFHKPGRLDDLLAIDQMIEDRSRTQIKVRQTAKRIHPEGPNLEPELIASAVIHIVGVDATTLRPKALPDWLFPLNSAGE